MRMNFATAACKNNVSGQNCQLVKKGFLTVKRLSVSGEAFVKRRLFVGGMRKVGARSGNIVQTVLDGVCVDGVYVYLQLA